MMAADPKSDTPADDRIQEGAEHPPKSGGLGGFLRGVFRSSRGEEGGLRETLEELLGERSDASDTLSDDEALLITNVLRLREVMVEDVMVPRAEIVSVNVEDSVEDIIALFVSSGHSRLPAFRDTLDNPLGMIHIKDMVCPVAGIATSVESAVREVLYISPSARIFDLIREMRLRRIHMALIVDEYGGIDGLVTIEDLIEQIVGDIVDEHDHDTEPDLILRDDGTAEVDGRMELEDFEKHFGGSLFTEEEREEIDTLGGLVFRLAGRVPARGEVIRREGGPDFEILDANPRTIKRVRVVRLPPASPQS